MTDIPRKDWVTWNWEGVDEDDHVSYLTGIVRDRRIAGLLAQLAKKGFGREEMLAMIGTALEEVLEEAPRFHREAGFIAQGRPTE